MGRYEGTKENPLLDSQQCFAGAMKLYKLQGNLGLKSNYKNGGVGKGDFL